ncbi:MAG: MFS transporter [Rhabdochlamydiaceae bacterium]|nr:MFS transporter [Rhabdochlamydiaceae bacterium]
MQLAKSDKPQFTLLLLLVSFASVGAVLFTPALPSITTFFGISVAEAQFTITAYLIGYAIGQLPYGPLANRYGRKITLYIGISLAILGSLLCALAAPLMSFSLLIFARVLQALGACVGLKISFTMIADVYEQTEATKMISRILIAFAIMPGLAVALGGWITHLLNWQSCFYFLGLFGIVVLWLSTKLPETAASLDQHALKVSSILHGYAVKFKNKRLVTSALMMGCGTSVVYVFAAKAPFIGIDLIGMTTDAFGNYNLIPLLGMLFGALLSAKIAGRFSLLYLLLTGIVTALAMTLTMLIPFSMGKFNALTLFFPMFLIYIAQSLVFANISSFGLASAKNKSNGSAVLNFINLSTTVVALILLEFIYPESAIVLPLSFVFFFCMMLFLWWRLRKLSVS